MVRVEQRSSLALDAAEAGWWFRGADFRMAASEKAFEISGLAPAAYISQDEWMKTIVPEDLPHVWETVARVRNELTSLVKYGYRVNHPQKGLRHIVCTGRPILSGNRMVGAHGIMWDDTERHGLEQELRQARDVARRAVAVKSRMLAVAGHDLRQPLQSVFMFAAALGLDDDPKRRTETLAMMNSSLTTLRSLLDGLVEIASIDSGSVEPKLSDFSLGPILQDIVGQYRLRVEAKGLSLNLVTSAACVRSDPVLLGRMIRNLLENAINHTSQGGIAIRTRAEARRVDISVTDTGTGIPFEQQEAIWEEFRQGDGDFAPRGVGLGLAIVRELGQALGHEVRMVSSSGEGSTFTISVARSDAEPSIAAQPDDAHVAPMRILVVDDDAMVRIGLEAVLSLLGHDVLVRERCDGALEAVREWEPDFLIADYRLQGEDGIRTISRLREALGRKVPALLLTGDIVEEVVAKAAREGVDVLEKPFPPDELARIMIRTLAGAPGSAVTGSAESSPPPPVSRR